ncbi:MAG: hypothetical protein ACJAW3_001122 [Lentimonas sp.]|jgi:hypothetical protein
MKKIYSTTIILLTFIFLQSCTGYSTNLNEMETLQVSSTNEIKKGESCSRNLFGGFKLPYVGDTAIKLSGDESVISAIKDGKLTSVYAVDKSTRNYFLYSRRCTIVFGK